MMQSGSKRSHEAIQVDSCPRAGAAHVKASAPPIPATAASQCMALPLRAPAGAIIVEGVGALKYIK